MREPKLISEDLLRRLDQMHLLLIHVPKTAGTSLSTVLYGREIGHLPAVDVAVLYPIRFGAWLKFAVLREPVDRFLSAYDFLKAGGNHETDERFSRRFLAAFDDVSAFLDAWSDRQFRHDVTSWYHFRPQTFYVSIGSVCIVNHLARYDHLEGDLQSVIGRAVALPEINRTPGKRTDASALSPRALETLHDYYRSDFRLWRFCNEQRGNLFGRRF